MAETLKSFNTAQGDFNLVRHDNGREEMYLSHQGVPVRVGHNKVIEMYHDPSLENLPTGPPEEGRTVIAQGPEPTASRRIEVAVDEPPQLKERGQESGVEGREPVWLDKAGKPHEGRVVVVGPSPEFPDGIDPRNGTKYLEIEVYSQRGDKEHKDYYKKVRADRIILKNGESDALEEPVRVRSETDVKIRQDETKKEIKGNFLEKTLNPHNILKLQDAANAKLSDLESKLTGDLKVQLAPSLREGLKEQAVLETVEDYLSGLPESEKASKEFYATNLVKEMSQDRDWLEAKSKAMGTSAEKKEGQPKEVLMRGVDYAGQKYLLKVHTDGRPVEVNRNVDDNWNIHGGDSGWFELPDTRIDLLNPPAKPSDEAYTAVMPEVQPEVEQISEAQAKEYAKQRSRSRWDKARDWLRHPFRRGHIGLMNVLKGTRQAPSPDRFDATIVPSGPAGPGGPESPAADAGSPGGPNSPRRVITVEEENTPARPERRERDRRTVAAVAVGALAMGGGVVLGYFLSKHGMPHGDIINNFCNGDNDLLHHHHHHGGGSDILGNLPQSGHGGHLEHLSVHNGNWHDTIWNHVQHISHGNNVHANTEKVLEMNRHAIMQYAQPGETSPWQAAHHLPEHFEFKIPDHF